MKKSNIIFLLVVQVILLFIFSNVYTLFKPLEQKESEAVMERANLTAELLVYKYKLDYDKTQEAAFFDHISLSTGSQPTRSIMKTDETSILTIELPVPGFDNRSVIFKKEITSLTLTLLKKLNKTFSNLSIFLSIFLLLTGFYLIYLFKKEKGFDKIKGIPPLQDYLLELKGAEQQLKNIVKQQQESVTRQDELNKSIINNINAAVIFLNPTGRIDIFNPVAERLFSQSYAHARNNLPDIILNKYPEVLRFIKENEAKNISAEIASEAQEKIFAVDHIPIDHIGKLIIIKDISEEKKREIFDRRNKNFIMLGEMTAYLAHEIRNSLGIIYGYTKTLESAREGMEKANLEEKINKVNQEINFLSTMMETFLNFSRPIQVEKKEKIDLSRLLKEIALEKEIELELSGDRIELDNDPTLMHSIFSNLMLNSKEAGAVKIEIHIRQNQQLEILFKDNGSGIDEKIKEKIWYPFFSTKYKGTGMGLAIIRKIINTMHGEITLHHSSPKGTSFKITFYR